MPYNRSRDGSKWGFKEMRNSNLPPVVNFKVDQISTRNQTPNALIKIRMQCSTTQQSSILGTTDIDRSSVSKSKHKVGN